MPAPHTTGGQQLKTILEAFAKVPGTSGTKAKRLLAALFDPAAVLLRRQMLHNGPDADAPLRVEVVIPLALCL